ncbi:hypothetical protein CR513_57206, partial [Mucuna pruriens]
MWSMRMLMNFFLKAILTRMFSKNYVAHGRMPLLPSIHAVGRPIKVSKNMFKVEYERFIRIFMWLNKHYYKVEYKGLRIIYALSGCYGHLAIIYYTRPQEL